MRLSRPCKVDLALRAVAAAEGIDADEADLDARVRAHRDAVQPEAEPGRKAYEQNDVVPELASQMRKGKALDWLIHHVEMVDPDGNPLDRDVILGHTHDADGGHSHDDHSDDDHDHDHDDDDPAHAHVHVTVDAPESTEAQA